MVCIPGHVQIINYTLQCTVVSTVVLKRTLHLTAEVHACAVLIVLFERHQPAVTNNTVITGSRLPQQ